MPASAWPLAHHGAGAVAATRWSPWATSAAAVPLGARQAGRPPAGRWPSNRPLPGAERDEHLDRPCCCGGSASGAATAACCCSRRQARGARAHRVLDDGARRPHGQTSGRFNGKQVRFPGDWRFAGSGFIHAIGEQRVVHVGRPLEVSKEGDRQRLSSLFCAGHAGFAGPNAPVRPSPTSSCRSFWPRFGRGGPPAASVLSRRVGQGNAR
jgi:hypothetical protein